MNGLWIALIVVVVVVLIVVAYSLSMARGKAQAAREHGKSLGMGEVRQDYAREQYDRQQLDADWDSMNEDYAQRAAKKAAKRDRKCGA